MAKTPHSQRRWPRFNPWSGNWIPHGTAKSLQRAMKGSASAIICFGRNLKSSYSFSFSLSPSLSCLRSLLKVFQIHFLLSISTGTVKGSEPHCVFLDYIFFTGFSASSLRPCSTSFSTVTVTFFFLRGSLFICSLNNNCLCM